MPQCLSLCIVSSVFDFCLATCVLFADRITIACLTMSLDYTYVVYFCLWTYIKHLYSILRSQHMYLHKLANETVTECFTRTVTQHGWGNVNVMPTFFLIKIDISQPEKYDGGIVHPCVYLANCHY